MPSKRFPGALLFAGCFCLPLFAQTNHLNIDASAAAPAVAAVEAQPGSSMNPKGETLTANSRYLTLNGKPWLPVMGEMQYSRVPEADWEHAILQMKANGIQIISTYIIWIHQEQTEGVFDWTGDRDLRRFAQMCAKHGMLLYIRVGPWSHAEVRNGGLPDWVIKRGKTRQNDPTYLAEVKTYFDQIGLQLRGLYWKDGGPVVGTQLENEYRESGPGRGVEHIRTLKKMAQNAGMDTPFYSVTGWDGAAIPKDAALPFFGGYADAPWGDSTVPLQSADVYSFRFENRAAGNMGAIGGQGQSAAAVYSGTPFLTTEIGSGTQETYFRRLTISDEDVAAVVPVMLGSGVNLLGYYMFHGGRNPDGGAITLQESQRTGYPTDVPVKSYDFQAPLSADGEEKASFNQYKLFHYFVNDFGGLLAPMAVHAPSSRPAAVDDLSVARVSARTLGDAGFVFFNNYARNTAMPERPGFSVGLKLPHESLTVPHEAITLPAGSYGIWPVNFNLNGVLLRYSTAQLFTKASRGDETYFVFFTIPGVAPEMLLETGARVADVQGFQQTVTSAGNLLKAQGADGSFSVENHGRKSHVILMAKEEAEKVWKVGDPAGLIMTASQFFADGAGVSLRNDGDPSFGYGLFGAAPVDKSMVSSGRRGMFTLYAQKVRGVTINASVTADRKAGLPRPWQDGAPISWRKRALTLAPDEDDFAKAATWTVHLRGDFNAAGVSDVLLHVDYDGDVARMYQGKRLLDDNFWNGAPWEVSTESVKIDPKLPLQLSILPLPRPFPMFFQNGDRLPKVPVILGLKKVEAIPQYELKVRLKPLP